MTSQGSTHMSKFRPFRNFLDAFWNPRNCCSRIVGFSTLELAGDYGVLYQCASILGLFLRCVLVLNFGSVLMNFWTVVLLFSRDIWGRPGSFGLCILVRQRIYDPLRSGDPATCKFHESTHKELPTEVAPSPCYWVTSNRSHRVHGCILSKSQREI